MIEGLGSYEFGPDPPVPVLPGAVKLLTAPTSVSHAVNPGSGQTVRWFSVVAALPGRNGLRSAAPVGACRGDGGTAGRDERPTPGRSQGGDPVGDRPRVRGDHIPFRRHFVPEGRPRLGRALLRTLGPRHGRWRGARRRRGGPRGERRGDRPAGSTRGSTWCSCAYPGVRRRHRRDGPEDEPRANRPPTRDATPARTLRDAGRRAKGSRCPKIPGGERPWTRSFPN